MIGSSTRPAGCSQMKLHRLLVRAEGGAMSLPGPSRHKSMSALWSLLGAERKCPSHLQNEVIDPEPTCSRLTATTREALTNCDRLHALFPDQRRGDLR